MGQQCVAPGLARRLVQTTPGTRGSPLQRKPRIPQRCCPALCRRVCRRPPPPRSPSPVHTRTHTQKKGKPADSLHTRSRTHDRNQARGHQERAPWLCSAGSVRAAERCLVPRPARTDLFTPVTHRPVFPICPKPAPALRAPPSCRRRCRRRLRPRWRLPSGRRAARRTRAGRRR